MIIIVICNLILMHNYAGGWGEGRVVAHGHTIGGGGRSPRAHFTAANLTSSACGDLLAIPSLYAPWCRAHASPVLNWKRMGGGKLLQSAEKRSGCVHSHNGANAPVFENTKRKETPPTSFLIMNTPYCWWFFFFSFIGLFFWLVCKD